MDTQWQWMKQRRCWIRSYDGVAWLVTPEGERFVRGIGRANVSLHGLSPVNTLDVEWLPQRYDRLEAAMDVERPPVSG